MIIANQNVNDDDLAVRLSALHEKSVGFNPLVIRATNLDVERDALIHSFRSPRDDDIRDFPGMADFLQSGIDNDTIKDFAENKGDFAKRNFGGIYKLEILMRAMLNAAHRPALKRELEKLGDPAQRLTQEQMNALKATVKSFMQEVFSRAHAVVCTFVVAQALVKRDYFRPVAVLVDEASREHESLIRYVQLGIDPLVVILTGDHRQDKPYSATTNVNVKNKNEALASHFNVFLNQYLTPLPQRMMEEAPQHVVFLRDNFRQRGGLQELASQLFYDGKMRTPFDRLDPDPLSLLWHNFGQELINENRKRRRDADVDKDKAEEFLTGNRVTMICESTRQTRGRSSINQIQARLAVDMAAKIHQSGIPGTNSGRPEICIITPYAAQVTEIKSLRRASPQKLCKLISVRTQSNVVQKPADWDTPADAPQQSESGNDDGGWPDSRW